VVKKCGIIQQNQSLDNMTLNQYLHLYKKIISDDSMQAIMKLTDIATEKIEKKKKTPKVKVKKDKKDKTKNLLAGKLSKALMDRKNPKKGGQPPQGVTA
jgi:hypothetical protein